MFNSIVDCQTLTQPQVQCFYLICRCMFSRSELNLGWCWLLILLRGWIQAAFWNGVYEQECCLCDYSEQLKSSNTCQISQYNAKKCISNLLISPSVYDLWNLSNCIIGAKQCVLYFTCQATKALIDSTIQSNATLSCRLLSLLFARTLILLSK